MNDSISPRISRDIGKYSNLKIKNAQAQAQANKLGQRRYLLFRPLAVKALSQADVKQRISSD